MAVVRVWLYLVALSCSISAVYHSAYALKPKACTTSDYELVLLPCSGNNTRAIVPYMKTPCDATANSSYVPKVIFGLPCQCPPGKGMEITKKPSFSWACMTCKPGNFSVGGKVIDTWEQWNGSLNVPGSGYGFTPFCVTVVKGRSCTGWQPSNDFTHLVSSPILNGTHQASCLEKKSMQTYMTFNNDEIGENYISFRYKVDGLPCSNGKSVCRKGLSFYVDEKEVLKVDVQFSWAVFKYNLTKGTHLFRWTHVSKCSTNLLWFDVAYITHVTYVGVQKAHAVCYPCPAGTYSDKPGSTECIKCPYGTYQDKPGQTKCLKCPEGTFSHLGDKTCFNLMKCTASDYRYVPDPIEKCYLKDGKVIRRQSALVPEWPGMESSGPCISKSLPASTTNCTCPSGSKLTLLHKTDGVSDVYTCQSCPKGQIIGSTGACGYCPDGKAAISSVHLFEWPLGPLSSIFKTACSGDYCSGVGWMNDGVKVSTRRIPGNFETYIELKDLQIDYYLSSVRFQCAVDCRINPVTNSLARNEDCFLRFTMIFNGSQLIRDANCIRYGKDDQRNGTIMNHHYAMTEKGKYTLRWAFHQNDNEKTNVLSYQASVSAIHILGVQGGPAKQCIKCAKGSQVSSDGTSCEKCPIGTFSSSGRKCIPCPEGYFTDKIRSSECIKCGANTTSNEDRTDCLINECKFHAAAGILYDLMPMANVGGPMTEVKQFPLGSSPVWYSNYFYVNLCTRNHDNSSCTDLQQVPDGDGKFIKEMTVLKTMACKRWSFTSRYSYSIGRVIGFKPKPDVYSGLIVELTDGYNCYNKHGRKVNPARTTIDLICDLDAGVGVPMPLSNDTAVETEPCKFQLMWRSRYACPICLDRKTYEFHSKCVNGLKNITYEVGYNCRNRPEKSRSKHRYFVPCSENSRETSAKKTVSNATLIVFIVIFVLIAVSLFVTVIFLLRKNMLYRMQLFSPGTHMKELKDDDLHELIDD